MNKRKLAAILLLALLTVSVVSIFQPTFHFISSVAATDFFDDGFEHGQLNPSPGVWTSNFTEVDGNSSLSVVTDFPHSGTYCMNATIQSRAAWTSAYAQYDLSPIQPIISTRFYVNISSYPTSQTPSLFESSSSLTILTLRISSNGNLSLYYRNTTAGGFETISSNTQISLNTWTALEVNCSVLATGYIHVFKNDEEVADLAIVEVNNTDAGSHWHYKLGIINGYNTDAQAFFDDVVIADSHIGFSSSGYEVTAASGGIDDLQAAIDEVYAQGNGTVYIPAGTFTFDPNGTAFGKDNKPTGVKSYGGIDIIGAGASQTILNETQDPPVIGYAGTSMISVDGTNEIPFRISGIKFQGHITRENVSAVGLQICGGTDFRIDNCWFDSFDSQGINAKGAVYPAGANRGVIDHCNFTNSYKEVAHPDSDEWKWGYGVIVWSLNPDTWADFDTILGEYYEATNVVYIENCWFNACRHAVSESQGGYYVIRYCNITNNVLPNYGSIDTHGFNKGRGCEAYNNTVTATLGYGAAQAVWLRGGENTVFDNTFINCSHGIQIYSESTAFYQVKNSYFWDITMDGGGTWFQNNAPTDYTENVTYFLYERPDYTSFTYPHPLTYADMPPTYGSISSNETVAGEPCLISVLFNDNYGLSHYASQDNNTGTLTWSNGTFSTTPQWLNRTLNPLNTTDGQVVRWRVGANDTADQWTWISWQYIPLEGASDRFYFGFRFRCLDDEDVSTSITWTLSNASGSIEYTNASTVLSPTSYTLSVTYVEHEINSTSLTTSTHGNTTITFNLNMKEVTVGYIAFNTTITTMPVYADSPRSLVVDPTASAATLVVVAVARNCTHIMKGTSNMTTWTYTTSPSNHITFTVTSMDILAFWIDKPPIKVNGIEVIVKVNGVS